MENINEAISLLIVGMIMVFFILFLVVLVGKVVIQLTNHYLPEVQKANDAGVALKVASPKQLAVLAAVVDTITQGEGSLDTVEKK